MILAYHGTLSELRGVALAIVWSAKSDSHTSQNSRLADLNAV